MLRPWRPRCRMHCETIVKGSEAMTSKKTIRGTESAPRKADVKAPDNKGAKPLELDTDQLDEVAGGRKAGGGQLPFP